MNSTPHAGADERSHDQHCDCRAENHQELFHITSPPKSNWDERHKDKKDSKPTPSKVPTNPFHDREFKRGRNPSGEKSDRYSREYVTREVVSINDPHGTDCGNPSDCKRLGRWNGLSDWDQKSGDRSSIATWKGPCIFSVGPYSPKSRFHGANDDPRNQHGDTRPDGDLFPSMDCENKS
jgi:hypothetical protein